MTTLLLASSLTPQVQVAQDAEKTVPATQQELAAALSTAHRPGGSTDAIEQFEAKIVMTAQGTDQSAIDVTLDIIFGSAVEYAPGRNTGMIRYQLEDRDTIYQRGMDLEGEWMLKDGKVTDLASRDFKADRDLVAEHMILCQHMLTLLDPGRMVAGLTNATGIEDSSVTLMTRETVAAFTLIGDHASFPIFRAGEPVRRGRARVQVWVDKESHRLLALEAFPLDATGQRIPQGQYFFLGEFSLRNQLLLPQTLRFYEINLGVRRYITKVALLNFLAGADLDKTTFSRDVNWTPRYED